MSYPVIKSNAVLLDFDGVVFHNKKVFQKVQQKTNQFIAKKQHLHVKQVVDMNKKYKYFGHSVFLLDRHDYKDNLKEYNDFVFSNYSEYTCYVNEDDRIHFQQLIDIKNEKNLEFYLFTNAPVFYCYEMMNAAGLRMDDLFRLDKMFASDIGILKSDIEAYKNIEKNIKEKKLHFIDDNLFNILPIVDKSNWSGFMIKTKDQLYDHLNHFVMDC